MQKYLIILFLFTSSLAFGESVYVSPVSGSNVSQKDLKTLRELIMLQVSGDSNHQLVNNLGNAQSTLQAKIVKFDSYTLSMARWQNNKKVNSGQWKAKDQAELEKIVATAVPEVLNTKANTQKAVLFENKKSLAQQADENRKNSNFETVKSRRQVMIGFGPAYFSNMNTSSSALGFEAAYNWIINDHFDLGLVSDFAISTDHSDAYAFIGKVTTNYHFATRDISPFLGGGFGYGWASVHDGGSQNNISDDTAGGFALSVQGGVKFFRTSDINFSVSAEYTSILDKSSLGNPGIFYLKAGLYF